MDTFKRYVIADVHELALLRCPPEYYTNERKMGGLYQEFLASIC